jgi:hypothetical protein
MARGGGSKSLEPHRAGPIGVVNFLRVQIKKLKVQNMELVNKQKKKSRKMGLAGLGFRRSLVSPQLSKR